MGDPLTDVVQRLQPQAVLANLISGKGAWAVRYAAYGKPGFCIVLEGSAVLAVDGQAPITLQAGDFVLLPTTPAFTLSGFTPAPPVFIDPDVVRGGEGELRHGDPHGAPDMRSLGGAFEFAGSHAALLASLLPPVVHVRGAARLQQLVQWVGEEYQQRRPGYAYMLEQLVRMLLVEALRWSSSAGAPPGLLRGLGDARLARALERIHADVGHPWTVAALAAAAALSRSTFFERFTRTVGVPPMDYVQGWRMEVAKALLQAPGSTVAQVAERVGYGSSSTFSAAFSRVVGVSPGRFARR
ncbi:AraC family transcriptional regulator [Stenotrophomonas sp. 24(2023)]|uniref:AraC family transcriptional regulator n=1 Tax=Stenotrophomonas sp. 24(2023) TaxID=3068324 RepID=UPI0027E1C4F3|nr:AraC family transcriptional regulator [Stenotrophomonas sp. 24(2023)]WMJ70847.1 AraC family transcriptional regulator [Stenotrophomonas sp. 24(2023)]